MLWFFTLVKVFGIKFNQVGTLEGLKGQKLRLLFKITDKKNKNKEVGR